MTVFHSLFFFEISKMVLMEQSSFFSYLKKGASSYLYIEIYKYLESSFWLLRLVFISMSMLFIEFMVFSISAWPTPFSNYSKYCIIYYLCMSKRNKSPLFSQFISQFWSIQLLLLPLPTFSFQSSQYPDWCQWKSCFHSHILSKTFIKHQFGARWKKWI